MFRGAHILIFMVVGFFINACVKQEAGDKGENDMLLVENTYVCPMQCEGSTSHEPGTCPVCNMMLVKSIELDSADLHIEHSSHTIYDESFQWKNQNNEVVNLNEFAGKYQLVSMIFTHCDYACPNLIADMMNIDDRLESGVRGEVDFLLISIDPERDTPERLHQYADNFELDERWKLLNGNDVAVKSIAQSLGVSYKKFENGAFGHSNVISLLNKKGEIVYQLEGIHAERSKLLAILNGII